jgi:hypothetical protein
MNLQTFGNTALVPIEQPVGAMVNFESAAVVREAANRPLVEMTAKQREVATQRLLFCRRVWSLVRTGLRTEDACDAEALRTESYPLLIKGGRKGRSSMTPTNYRVWIRHLGRGRGGVPRWDNLLALADRYGKNLRGLAGAPEFWAHFENVYLRESKLSISKSYALACKMLSSSAAGGHPPTERQVRYWLATYKDQAAIMVARHGEVWAENHCAGYIRRDWSTVKANDLWIGDHHVFDCTVKVWDDAKGQWRAVRPWLTAWLDAKSLSFVGVLIRAEDPNHEAILIALVNGIMCAGGTPPGCLYTDNGKDFLKTGLGEPFSPEGTEAKHSVLGELGITTLRAIPYRARSKTIERMFKEVCDGFSRRWAQYLGNRPDARPEVAGFFHENPEHLPSLQQFCEAFMKWLDEEYHAKPQDGKILQGKSPREAWADRPEGRVLSKRDLWFASLVPYTKNCPKVGRGVAVTVDGHEYRADALWNYFGKKIMVKMDVVGSGPPQAFDLDGRYICGLEPIIPIPALATSADDRKRLSDEIRRQRHEVKRAFGVADQLGGLRRIAPQELLSLTPGEPIEIVKVQNRRSVRGGCHNFSLHVVKTGGFPIQDTECDQGGDDAREDRELTAGEARQVKLIDFGQAQQEEAEEPAADAESIAAFHKHIITQPRRRNDDDQDGRSDY